MTQMPTEINQRRITLQIFLQSNQRVTLEQIKKLPIYAQLNLAAQKLGNRIHEDLQILRDSGIDIVVEKISGQYFYRIDTRDEVPVKLAAEFDATLLRTILRYHSQSEQVLYAKSGVNKLLANAQSNKQSGRKSTSLNHIFAKLPQGAFIPQLAKAIADRKGIAIAYFSLKSEKIKTYYLLPRRLEIHFESFYLRAWQIDLQKPQKTLPESQLFRTSRILAPPKPFFLPKETQSAFQALEKETVPNSQPKEINFLETKNSQKNLQLATTIPAVAENPFAQVEAIVAVNAAAQLPLAKIGLPIPWELPVNGGNLSGATIFQLPPMYREDLFELLCFYGVDVQLIAPAFLRDEFLQRLQHLVTLSETTNG